MIENKNWKILYIPSGQYLRFSTGSYLFTTININSEYKNNPELYLHDVITCINRGSYFPSVWGLEDNRPFSKEHFEIIYD